MSGIALLQMLLKPIIVSHKLLIVLWDRYVLCFDTEEVKELHFNLISSKDYSHYVNK